MKNDLVRTKCMVTTAVVRDVRYFAITYYNAEMGAFATRGDIRTRKQLNDELRSIYWGQYKRGYEVEGCVISLDALTHITRDELQ